MVGKRSWTSAAVAATLLAALLGAGAAALAGGGEATSKTGPSHQRPRAASALRATTRPEARQMRHATRLLAGELGAAARCPPALSRPRFIACVAPALRHAGIGGRTSAMLLRTVLAPVRDGRCRTYLLDLQAANEGAADSAR